MLCGSDATLEIFYCKGTLFWRTKNNFQKNVVVPDFWYVGERTLLVNKIDENIFLTAGKTSNFDFLGQNVGFGYEKKWSNFAFMLHG